MTPPWYCVCLFCFVVVTAPGAIKDRLKYFFGPSNIESVVLVPENNLLTFNFWKYHFSYYRLA